MRNCRASCDLVTPENSSRPELWEITESQNYGVPSAIMGLLQIQGGKSGSGHCSTSWALLQCLARCARSKEPRADHNGWGPALSPTEWTQMVCVLRVLFLPPSVVCVLKPFLRVLSTTDVVDSCCTRMSKAVPLPSSVSELCLRNVYGSNNAMFDQNRVSIDKRMRRESALVEWDGKCWLRVVSSQVPQPKLASGHHGSWGTWLTEGAFLYPG